MMCEDSTAFSMSDSVPPHNQALDAAIRDLTAAVRDLTEVMRETARDKPRTWEQDDEGLRGLCVALYLCPWIRGGVGKRDRDHDDGGWGFCAEDLIDEGKDVRGNPLITPAVRLALAAAVGHDHPAVEEIEAYLANHCGRRVDGVSVRHQSTGQGRRVVDVLVIRGPRQHRARPVYKILPVGTHVGVGREPVC